MGAALEIVGSHEPRLDDHAVALAPSDAEVLSLFLTDDGVQLFLGERLAGWRIAPGLCVLFKVALGTA
jgi:hypothetical protein